MSARSAARIRTLLLICAALVVAISPSPGAVAAWHHVSAYDGVISTASAPQQALDAREWRRGSTRHLAATPGGGLLLVHETDNQWQMVCLITADEASPVLTATWGRNHVEGVVAAGGDVYVAAVKLLRVESGVAIPQYCACPDALGLRVRDRPGPEVGPVGLTIGVPVADGTATVWAVTPGVSGPICFSADRRDWATGSGGDPVRGPLPWAQPWHVPVDAMAGDPARPGLWTYGRHRDGRGGIFYVDGYDPGLPSVAGVEFPHPNVAYPRRDKGHTELLKHERSAAPEGVTAPQLQTPLIAADITGRCWLAEGAEGAASIHVFDGQAFTNVTPPPELLKGSQLRQLVCDNPRGELLVATSGAGVLVFDGTHWSEHPLNSVLPTVRDTAMKPVDRIAVAEDSSVWVATASYLLHWTRGEGE